MSDARIRGELDEIGTQAAVELKRRDFRACLRASWSRAARRLFWWPLLFGVLVEIGVVSQRVSPPGWPFRFVTLLLAALACAGLNVLVDALRSAKRSLDESDGLARLDRELHSEGRLQAAYEFSDKAAPSPFEEAAVEDAQSHVERARAHRLAKDAREPTPRSAWLGTLGAVALCALLAVLIPDFRRAAAPDGGSEAVAAVAPRGESAQRPRDESTRKDAPPTSRPKEGTPKPREQGVPSLGEERAAALEQQRETRESLGKTGEGRSAQATPTSSSSESRGFMSSQSPPSEPGEPGKPNDKKIKKPAKKGDDAAPRKKLDEPSGSTAGKGSGSGSSKNPGATDWQSKDQVTTDEEQPLENEEDVDDESDESEARGGLQPSLRDRRPSVNRDLTIGFGNEPNPDANGRGGPSEQKKSRGVASLVLGVPIPDHVKGQPNPGRTKITQERVEPRSDEAAPIEAAARTPRAQPIGALNRRELEPWMAQLVRGYFLKLRTKSESKP